MGATLCTLRDTLTRRWHEPPNVVGQWPKRLVQGYFNYNAVPGNLQPLEGFRSEVCRAWRHALLRRSQRHRLSWDRFKPFCSSTYSLLPSNAPLSRATIRSVTTLGRNRMR
jgi:RNA-directed DNA polymerase